MTVPSVPGEPSDYRDQIAEALAENFTPDYQRNPKFDRKRERAWFDAGNPDEEPANSEYIPLPMAERVRLDLMVMFTAADGDRSIRPVRIPEVVEVVAAVRDTEMEQLRTQVAFLEGQYERARNVEAEMDQLRRRVERIQQDKLALHQEAEQARALLAALQDARDSLVAERDRAYDQRDGLARRASLMRRNYIEAARSAEEFVEFSGEQSNRLRELEAELAELRERAVILPEDWRGELQGQLESPDNEVDVSITIDGIQVNIESTFQPIVDLIELWCANPAPATAAQESAQLAEAIGTEPARTTGICPEHGEHYSMFHGPHGCTPEFGAPNSPERKAKVAEAFKDKPEGELWT